MKKEETSCELITACFDLFMKFGIKRLTMEDVSKRLGISKKTLYKFVSDKKELVRRGVEQALEEDQLAVSEIKATSNNAIEELIGFTKATNARLLEIDPSVVSDLKKYHEDTWILFEEHKNKFFKNAILENVNRGISEGFYRDNLNPEIIATLFIMMKDGLFNSSQPFGEKLRIHEIHLEIIRYHVCGVANEKGIAVLKNCLSKEENNYLNLD